MKTARAIEPNAGTRREYVKRVNRLVNQFLDLMTDEILLHVAARLVALEADAQG